VCSIADILRFNPDTNFDVCSAPRSPSECDHSEWVIGSLTPRGQPGSPVQSEQLHAQEKADAVQQVQKARLREPSSTEILPYCGVISEQSFLALCGPCIPFDVEALIAMLQ
jgi:hypothetical protein